MAYQVPLEALFPAIFAHAREAVTRYEAICAEAKRSSVSPCVLALYPGTRKVGIAVLEVPTRRLIKAQVRNVEATVASGGIVECSRHLALSLFEAWQPEVLVIEQTDYRGSRRSRALLQVAETVISLAQQRQMTVKAYTPADLHKTLIPDGLGRTKAMLCRILVHQYPELGSYLPKLCRGIGDSEPYYFRLFMAVALGLTWLRTEGRKQW
jgi:Holliday junction resolvasome RuvABC endonuclease subunit